MSDINGKYKQILEDLEKNITDPNELKFVQGKFSELSMLFIDMLDRVTRLTDSKVQEIEGKQQEITSKVNSIQAIVDGIQSDIYEEDDNYEFEIVCPYCNYEFVADIEDEDKDEVQCPECNNTIELDWNIDEDFDSADGCESRQCLHCAGCVAENEEEYDIKDEEDDYIEEHLKKNVREDDDEDM